VRFPPQEEHMTKYKVTTFAMQPFLYADVRGKRCRWESFDVPRIEFTDEDGVKRIHWDDEKCYCTFIDESTGERSRLHLQDKDWMQT
jgi:hypothetical protein